MVKSFPKFFEHIEPSLVAYEHNRNSISNMPGLSRKSLHTQAHFTVRKGGEKGEGVRGHGNPQGTHTKQAVPGGVGNENNVKYQM